MKKLMIMAFALLMSATACLAQNEGRQRMSLEQRMEQLAKDLGLSDKQTKEFKALEQSRRQEMEKMRKSNERPSREAMEKSRTDMDAKVKKILTQEQYEKYQKMEKKQGPGRDHGKKKGCDKDKD